MGKRELIAIICMWVICASITVLMCYVAIKMSLDEGTCRVR